MIGQPFADGAALSGVLAAGAAWLLVPDGPEAVVRRRLGPRRDRRVGLGRLGVGRDLLAVLLGVGVLLVWGPGLVLVAATLTLVAGTALRLADRRRVRVAANAERQRVVEVCDALSAELRAGQPAVRAVQRVASEHPMLAPAARAAALGGDLPDALDSLAGRPGASGMRMIAAAWRVADRSGAGLAAVLDRVADALRAEQSAAAEVTAGLGPPRATARMLAVLPAFGLALGGTIGGDPVGFLLGTLAGNLCLLLGAGLAVLGVWWVERLAAGVERR
jgi:tight adherence protein B